MMDAIAVLTKDHQEVDTLFKQYEAANGMAQNREVVDKIICELSKHAAVEEQILYPEMRNLPTGDRLANLGLREHQKVKETLADLEDTSLDSAAMDRKMQSLMREVRHHVKEEETDFFPRLRASRDEDQLRALGRSLERAKMIAPTRPHPAAPNTPPGNLIAGPVAAAFDRVRDVLRSAMPAASPAEEEERPRSRRAPARARRRATPRAARSGARKIARRKKSTSAKRRTVAKRRKVTARSQAVSARKTASRASRKRRARATSTTRARGARKASPRKGVSRKTR